MSTEFVVRRSASGNETELPPWPALSVSTSYYLQTTYDYWYYLTLWSLVLTTIIYLLASLRAYFVFKSSSRFSFAIPILFTAVGALTGLVAGSIVGLSLSLLYQAGGFKMTTWIAMLWGVLQTLILILSSYSTITSLL